MQFVNGVIREFRQVDSNLIDIQQHIIRRVLNIEFIIYQPTCVFFE